MAGINQGRPELAVGEPIRLGNNDEFEIEQHPISDRLIIRDTQNGKVAYVRKERGGSIGGDGVLIKSLKEGKPMADDGRVYDTVQQAERSASSWVFVPPGTYNENLVVTTDGLTLRGSGYNTLIDGNNGTAVNINADNVSVSSLSLQNSTNIVVCTATSTSGTFLENVTVRTTPDYAIIVDADATVVNCTVDEAGTNSSNFARAFDTRGENCILNGCKFLASDSANAANNASDTAGNNIVANCIFRNPGGNAMQTNGGNQIIIGNRVIGSGATGIFITNDNCIVANNRVSDSANTDIGDNATGTLLDGNLTGASN